MTIRELCDFIEDYDSIVKDLMMLKKDFPKGSAPRIIIDKALNLLKAQKRLLRAYDKALRKNLKSHSDEGGH